MSRAPRLLLLALVLGVLSSLVGIGLTVISNWFFRGEASLSRDTILRLVVLGFVIGAMPVGLAWARSRREPN